MGDVYRETRTWRERGDSPSDDEHYKSTTVRRYKVTPSRAGDRYERSEYEDDRRSRVSAQPARSPGDYYEPDRRPFAPDRPRSAFDGYGGTPGPDRTTRSVVYEREAEREQPREARSYVYEKEVDRGDGRSRVSVYDKEPERDWDRRFYHDEDNMKIEKRVERREDGDYRVEKRTEEWHNDPHGCDVERYQKETEYYTPIDPPPAPAPVVIRQRAPEPQQIIVQEAPPPAPVIIPRQEPGVVVIREKEPVREVVRREPTEEEYYYRHERRETGGHRGDRDWAVERHSRRRGDWDRHSDDEDYYVRRTVVRRERSESPHHKRHLAEGALAGAGLTALFNSRRDEYGDLPENRGRKVFAGAALGALGTEALKRAHSAYGDRWGSDDESPDRHSRLKKGLGIAAVALAAAGAAKYYQSGKIEKEEARRGRSRSRHRSRGHYSGSEEYISRSRTRTRSSRRRSLSTAAKAALGTAATAGLVKHFRDKSKSKSRSPSHSRSRSRSKSRLRRGAELAAGAAAAGVANRMWKRHKDKKEDEEDKGYSSSDDDEYYRRRRRRPSGSRSRSRSRSKARSIHSTRGTDPELGLVEYGNDPLPTEPSYPSERAYESEAEERRRRRRKQRRERDRSSSASGGDRERSKSRLRNMAAAGAAAIGIKEYKDRKDREKQEELERERERERERDRREHRSRDRSQSKKRRENGSRSRDGPRFDESHARPSSPPMASGGAYYPPYPTGPTPPPGAGFAQYPNPNQPGEYQPYVPADYTGYQQPPPPQGPPGPPGPPPMASGGASGYPPPPPGPPTGRGQIPPDHVSRDTTSSQRLPGDKHSHDEGASPSRRTWRASPLPPPGNTEPEANNTPTDCIRSRSKTPPAAAATAATAKSRSKTPPAAAKDDEKEDDDQPSQGAKSVVFIPLSPKSSKTLQRHRRQQAEAEETEAREKTKEEKKKEKEASEDEGQYELAPARRHPRSRSEPGSRRSDESDSDVSVENLPDRFDSRGRRLNGRSSSQQRWTSRQGEFERRPQHEGDWDVKGAWQVAGTEGEAVERIVRGVTGVLEGKQNWIGLLGEVLAGGLEGGGVVGQRRELEDRDEEQERRRKYRKR